MDERKILFILIGIVLLMGVVLVLALMLGGSGGRSGSRRRSSTLKSPELVLYERLSRFKPVRIYLERIRRRVEMLELSDRRTVSIKTMRLAGAAVGASAALVLLLFMMSDRAYVLLIGCLTIYVVHQQILSLLIEGMDDRLLIQFEQLLGDVRHHFHEHGMIDEALYDAVEESPHEIGLHAHRMYEILTALDTETEMGAYYDLVPNKYFKTFLALCYSVQKFGDKIIDSESMFLKNMNYLKQEINLELLKRRHIRYLFKSLTLITLLPVFTLGWIEGWAKSNMAELSVYYDGTYGFYVQIGLFATVLVAYQLLHKMQIQSEDRTLFGMTLERLLYKNRLAAALADRLVAHNYSAAQRKAMKLKAVGAHMPIVFFYMKRIIYGAAVFVMLVLALNYGNRIQIRSIRDVMPVQAPIVDLGNGQTDPYNDGYWIDQAERFDYSSRQIYEAMLKSGYSPQLALRDSKRIAEKTAQIDEVFFKWYWLLPCFGLSLMAYFLPDMMLAFRRTMLQMMMEDEVLQFHTIILMLMHFERISVEDILEWMAMFSEVFKDALHQCLNDFEQGDVEALEALKREEPFLPFLRIVENLQAACDRIAIVQAFDELRTERGYYQEKRKQDNEIMIEKKRLWGRTIAFVPMGCTVFFYIILPFVHLSVTQFTQYSEQIQQFL